MEKTKKQVRPSCASCNLGYFDKICFVEKGKGSRGCPTVINKDVLEEANNEYVKPEIGEFAKQSSIQEGRAYGNKVNKDANPYILVPVKPRIIETYEFAKKMGYKKLGLAFCAGMLKEASIVEKILEKEGFEVVSVICKAGRVPKEFIKVPKEDCTFPGIDEAMCNPIFQAKMLNHEKTDFNILLGLCVGHDSLFIKFTDADMTVLAVKDRVTGHNPLAPLYLSDAYWFKDHSEDF